MNLSTLSIGWCAAMGPCVWSAVAVKLSPAKSRSVRLVGTTLDITDGKRRMRNSGKARRDSALLSLTFPTHMEFHAHGQIQYISPNAEQVLGFTSEEICEKGADFWSGRI